MLLVSAGAAAQQERGRQTGLPVPRFAALAADEVNWRVGPGLDYPIRWVYRRAGWPVEITAEFDNWRRVRDIEGIQGWVHTALLTSERRVLIRAQETPLYATRELEGSPRAILEAGVIARLNTCEPRWCRLRVEGHRGWVPRRAVWGVYEDESFD